MKAGGATPMIVHNVRFTRICLPSASLDAPYSDCQNAKPRTTTGAPAGTLSSCAVKNRFGDVVSVGKQDQGRDGESHERHDQARRAEGAAPQQAVPTRRETKQDTAEHREPARKLIDDDVRRQQHRRGSGQKRDDSSGPPPVH